MTSRWEQVTCCTCPCMLADQFKASRAAWLAVADPGLRSSHNLHCMQEYEAKRAAKAKEQEERDAELEAAASVERAKASARQQAEAEALAKARAKADALEQASIWNSKEPECHQLACRSMMATADIRWPLQAQQQQVLAVILARKVVSIHELANQLKLQAQVCQSASTLAHLSSACSCVAAPAEACAGCRT